MVHVQDGRHIRKIGFSIDLDIVDGVCTKAPRDGSHAQWISVYSAVALAFEELRTPYASGREIYVQKFGNVYQ